MRIKDLLTILHMAEIMLRNAQCSLPYKYENTSLDIQLSHNGHSLKIKRKEMAYRGHVAEIWAWHSPKEWGEDNPQPIYSAKGDTSYEACKNLIEVLLPIKATYEVFPEDDKE